MYNDGPQPGELVRETTTAPSRQYFLKEYPITIQFHSRGCVISVGCKSVAFNDVDEAMRALNTYVSNPQEEADKWRKFLD
jgi:hypothetical protein